MTTLATGFAAAVQPVSAQTTITTDTQGLAAGEVRIAVGDGEIPAGVAWYGGDRPASELAPKNAIDVAAGLHVYPDAPHGFHADYRPSDRREAAEDGWRRTLEWFQRHGAA